MASYDNLEQLDETGFPDLGIFSAPGPQTFPPQSSAALHGPPPSFHASDFPSQTRAHVPQRLYGYQGLPRSSTPQAHDASRPVNIILPTGGTDTQSLLILSKVESLGREIQESRREIQELGREIQELRREVQELKPDVVETKASLESVKLGLHKFMSSITIVDQEPGETPGEAA